MRFRLLPFILILFCCCFFGYKAQGQTITPGAVSGAITACIGAPSASPNILQVTVNGTGLFDGIAATAPAGFELSVSAGSGYSGTIILLPANGVVSATFYVRAAATGATGAITGNVVLSSAGAASKYVPVTAIINPLPVVNQVANQTVEAGALIAPVNFTGTGQVYSWINDNPTIGLPANGSGDIPPFNAINTGATAAMATVTVTPKPGGFIYVNVAGGISVVDMTTNRQVVFISLIQTAYRTMVSPDGRYVYALSPGAQTINVVSTQSNTVIQSWATPANFSQYTMALSPDGSKLAVGDLYKTLFYNTATGDMIAEVNAPSDIGAPIFNKSGSRFYTLSRSNELKVINTNTFAIEKTISVGFSTSEVLSPDDRFLYVADKGGLAGISVINTTTNSVVANISTGIKFDHLTISADGQRLYAISTDAGQLTIINASNNTVSDRLSLGANLEGSVLSIDGKYLYVGGDPNLFIISTATNSVIKTIPFSSGIPTINADGSRIYVPTLRDGRAIGVINPVTNTFVDQMLFESDPLISTTSFRYSTGCDGTPTTFTITVNPPPPTINVIGSISGLNTEYGTASGAGSIIVSGLGLQNPVTITPPDGFEVSVDNINFSKILNLGGAGALNSTVVYVRLAATTNAATYTGNIVLSSLGAASVNVPIANSVVRPVVLTINSTYTKTYGNVVASGTLDYTMGDVSFSNGGFKNGNTFNSIDITFNTGTLATDAAGVYPGGATISNLTGRNGYLSSNYTVNYPPVMLIIRSAPLAIKADKVTKPFGTVLTTSTGNTGYTVTGLKNNETIGNAIITYGAGAQAAAAAGSYPGAVMVSGAAGGTFTPANYVITYQPNDIEVLPAPPPTFTIVGAPQQLNTVYGTPSPSTSFVLSATNLTTAIVITAPAGFELSIDNSAFSNSMLIGGPGTMAARPIYIRLAAGTNVGSYSGDIRMSSGPTVNTVTIPLSIVTAAPLRVAATSRNKPYGDVLTDGSGAASFTITSGSLKNNDALVGANYVYGNGKAGTDAVGKYDGAIEVTEVFGNQFFLATNYTITFVKADINVVPADLNIKSENVTRVYGSVNPVSPGFTATGLKNGETIASVNYSYANGTQRTSAAGTYPNCIAPSNPGGGTFVARNYSITYTRSDLTITPAPLTIKAADATRNYGAANPSFTLTYTGFVNGETPAQLSRLPVITTTANGMSGGGRYPIVLSGAVSANYAITYINGTLTVNPPTELVIPNTFTPNNDGINDTWKIPALASYPNCIVQVFNRYGTNVYTSKGYAVEWDGTASGKDIPAGVYYYIIDTKLLNIKATGAITIVR